MAALSQPPIIKTYDEGRARSQSSMRFSHVLQTVRPRSHRGLNIFRKGCVEKPSLGAMKQVVRRHSCRGAFQRIPGLCNQRTQAHPIHMGHNQTNAPRKWGRATQVLKQLTNLGSANVNAAKMGDYHVKRAHHAPCQERTELTHCRGWGGAKGIPWRGTGAGSLQTQPRSDMHRGPPV